MKEESQTLKSSVGAPGPFKTLGISAFVKAGVKRPKYEGSPSQARFGLLPSKEDGWK